MNTPPDVPPAPKPAEPAVTPLVTPLAKLFGSQKFVVLLLAVVGVFAMVALGKVSWEQAVTFLTVSLPAWAIAHGIQDGMKAKAGE